MQKIEKIKQNRIIKEREKDPYLGHLPVAGPAPPPGGPAHLLPLVIFLPSHRSSSVASADAASATSCLPACLRYSLETPRGSLRPLSTPSRAHPLLLLSLSLRTSDPNGAVATDAVRRGHHPPLASPTPSRAPQVLPRPPRRLTRPEEPRNAAPDVFPLAGRRGSSPSNSATPARPRAR